MILSSLKIRMLRDFETLKKNNVYPVKFETDKFYIVLHDNIYIHVILEDAEGFYGTETLENGQIRFLI